MDNATQINGVDNMNANRTQMMIISKDPQNRTRRLHGAASEQGTIDELAGIATANNAYAGNDWVVSVVPTALVGEVYYPGENA